MRVSRSITHSTEPLQNPEINSSRASNWVSPNISERIKSDLEKPFTGQGSSLNLFELGGLKRQLLVIHHDYFSHRIHRSIPFSSHFLIPLSDTLQVDGQDYQTCFTGLSRGRLAKKHARLLLRCPGKTADTKTKAKFQYTVSFRMFSPVPKGPEFACNQEYYFLGEF